MSLVKYIVIFAAKIQCSRCGELFRVEMSEPISLDKAGAIEDEVQHQTGIVNVDGQPVCDTCYSLSEPDKTVDHMQKALEAFDKARADYMTARGWRWDDSRRHRLSSGCWHKDSPDEQCGFEDAYTFQLQKDKLQ